jgi:hypothetical protein
MIDITTSFTLRRLELGKPILERVKKGEANATAELAAIIIADEQTLKLMAAGNVDALKVFIDTVNDMDSEEVATLISVFTLKSHRYSLVRNGLNPEEVNQLQSQTRKKLRTTLGLELQEN